MAKKSRNRFEEEDRLGLGLAMLEEILLHCPESGVHARTNTREQSVFGHC